MYSEANLSIMDCQFSLYNLNAHREAPKVMESHVRQGFYWRPSEIIFFLEDANTYFLRYGVDQQIDVDQFDRAVVVPFSVQPPGIIVLESINKVEISIEVGKCGIVFAFKHSLNYVIDSMLIFLLDQEVTPRILKTNTGSTLPSEIILND